MMHLALHLSRDAQDGRGHLLGFQAATAYRVPPSPGYFGPTLVTKDVPLLADVAGSGTANRTYATTMAPSTSVPVGSDRGALFADPGAEAVAIVTGGEEGEGACAGPSPHATHDAGRGAPSGTRHEDATVTVRGHTASGEGQRPSDIALGLSAALRSREHAGDVVTRKLAGRIYTLVDMMVDVSKTVPANTKCTTAYHAHGGRCRRSPTTQPREACSCSGVRWPPV